MDITLTTHNNKVDTLKWPMTSLIHIHFKVVLRPLALKSLAACFLFLIYNESNIKLVQNSTSEGCGIRILNSTYDDPMWK
jgi:hypothetical protein